MLELIVYYICFHAKQTRALMSKARLVKLIYLIDWKNAINYGQQMTSVSWYFNYYGPYVKEIIEMIDNSVFFEKCDYINQFGNKAEEIRLKSDAQIDEIKNKLTEKNCQIIDYVLSITKDIGYMEFLRLIYSTYPIMRSNKFEELDLEKLAIEYKNSNF